MNNIAKALDAILGDIKNLAESLAFTPPRKCLTIKQQQSLMKSTESQNDFLTSITTIQTNP